jgi:hypothetical protein
MKLEGRIGIFAVKEVSVLLMGGLLLFGCAADDGVVVRSDGSGGSGGAGRDSGALGGSWGGDRNVPTSDDVAPSDAVAGDGRSVDDSSHEASVQNETGNDASATETSSPEGSVQDARDADDAADASALPGCNVAEAHMRADDALDHLWSGFWNPTSRYFDASEPPNGYLTGYWTYAEAFDAMLDGVERTRGRKYRKRPVERTL